MKKWLITCTAALAFGVAHADDMSDAKTLLAQKQPAKAMQLFQTLADQDHTEAQVQLAEMYWYGDAGPVDLANAEQWFRKAAQKGDTRAQASLKVMAARVARKAEIEQYTQRYDGAEFSYAKANCTPPVFPDVSRTRNEIRDVDAGFKKWLDCHADHVGMLNASFGGGRTLPKGLADIMSDDDLAAARTRMEKVYADRAAEANKAAGQVMAQQQKWTSATLVSLQKNAADDKATMLSVEIAERQRQLDLQIGRDTAASIAAQKK